MKGAIGLFALKTMIVPNRSITKIIGASQNFFRSFMKFHKSEKYSI